MTVELLSTAATSAVHLELHDTYAAVDPEWVDVRDWEGFDPVSQWPDWFNLVRQAVSRGVVVRRCRVVTVPVSDYIRYEYALTGAYNVAAGEVVRWVDRHQALDFLAPLVDFWVIDGTAVVVNRFDVAGAMTEERHDDLAALYLPAFDRLWERAIPHEEFRV